MSDPDWAQWSHARPTTGLLHLDSGAAGRVSTAALDAMSHHQALEATQGAYVAEGMAAEVLTGLRARLGGLLGVPPDGVALTQSASGSLDVLLRAWRLPAGARVAVAPSEWGPNLTEFRAAGLRVEWLPVGADGVLDPDGLERLLEEDPPDLVHLVQVASHRTLVQPVAAAARRCRRAGVPLWVDAAQALGQVPAGSGADAVYAPSRKWLCGPRGVGVLGVAERAWGRMAARNRENRPAGLSAVRTWESDEAHVAGRLGLATALAELEERGEGAVFERLADVGRQTRERLARLDGWEVVAPATPGAITALRPTAGQDVVATRQRLLDEHRVLTSACLPWRAPGEAASPALRLSPHVDCSADDLERLATALGASAPHR